MKKLLPEYKDKWNHYEIGNIKFINNHKNHPAKMDFILHVIKKVKIKSIVEIGGGELIEAEGCRVICPNYTVIDISDTFLKYAKDLRFKCIKCDMIELDAVIKDKQFDLLYAAGVLEHSPDIVKTIKGMSVISERFFLSLFKWRVNGGSLNSHYDDERKYFTTAFNIFDLIRLIKDSADIDEIYLLTKEGTYLNYNQYISKFPVNNSQVQRDQSRLIITGKWN